MTGSRRLMKMPSIGVPLADRAEEKNKQKRMWKIQNTKYMSPPNTSDGCMEDDGRNQKGRKLVDTRHTDSPHPHTPTSSYILEYQLFLLGSASGVFIRKVEYSRMS